MNLKSLQSILAIIAAACGVLFLAGCGGGGGGGSTVTATKTAIVIGKLTTKSTAKAGGGIVLVAAGDPIEVHVESEPDIRTTVGADGSFTLRGLPEGSVTLVFTQGGPAIGTLTFREVAANQQITITIEVAEGDVILVDEDRRGIGHAGVELQGLVQNVVVLDPAGDSRFVIAGRSVVARPGVTAIREGITRRTVEDVTVGRQVHVKGTTVADSTDVLAYEIKLQNPTTDPTSPTDPTGTGGKPITICHVPPGNPARARTLTVDESAWPAHQAHGDTEGACPP
ncbi:MAG: carboxypeptidase-like regulatory domain-containing protein [Lysobacter sp.]|nr:carboxypeptidase-like regulatory domain-containing protein [Lysobacter sp.]